MSSAFILGKASRLVSDQYETRCSLALVSKLHWKNLGYNSHVIKFVHLISVQLSAFLYFHKVMQPSPRPHFRVF